MCVCVCVSMCGVCVSMCGVCVRCVSVWCVCVSMCGAFVCACVCVWVCVCVCVCARARVCGCGCVCVCVSVTQGYLWKKGHLRRNWTERWFSLKVSTLAYYISEDRRECKGIIDLDQNCCVEVCSLHIILGSFMSLWGFV